jgi:hypothetical protein
MCFLLACPWCFIQSCHSECQLILSSPKSQITLSVPCISFRILCKCFTCTDITEIYLLRFFNIINYRQLCVLFFPPDVYGIAFECLSLKFPLFSLFIR